MATVSAGAYQRDQRFFLNMAIGLALFIVFGFAQFAARGFVDYGAAPIWVHLHALVFGSWLLLFVMQNYLAANGNLALHRRLGWLSAGLVVVMVLLGSFTGIKAIELHRAPPFFSPPYFLALTHFGMLVFAGTVAAGIVKRRETEWHRRLMLAAAVLLLEPALGRILPMPLIGGGEVGEWYVLAIQLFVFALVMRHDRKVLGRVHPALLWGMGIVVVAHVGVTLLAHFPPFAAIANGLAGA